VAAELARLHTLLAGTARGLARDAQLAPHDAGAQELRSLAREDQELAGRVLSALVHLGGPVPLVADRPETSREELSYWQRLCERLEDHLQLRDAVEQARTCGANAPPDVFARLREASRQEEAHILRLRDLIARADPHGLD